jgi:hypothetical protein
VKTELDFGDHLEWISVERGLILYELYNGVVGILYGWLNFRKKILCLCVSHIDLLPFLVQALFLFRV